MKEPEHQEPSDEDGEDSIKEEQHIHSNNEIDKEQKEDKTLNEEATGSNKTMSQDIKQVEHSAGKFV